MESKSTARTARIQASVYAVVVVLALLVAKAAQVLLLLYAGIQAIESYGLTPFLQKRMVNLPPALLLTMQVLCGVLAGILGLIFATPLTAAAMVMVKKWYVEDMLGHRKAAQAAEVHAPGTP